MTPEIAQFAKYATILIAGAVIGWNTYDKPSWVTILLAVALSIAISFTFNFIIR